MKNLWINAYLAVPKAPTLMLCINQHGQPCLLYYIDGIWKDKDDLKADFLVECWQPIVLPKEFK